MNGKTHDTRQHILDVGYQLVLQKGFTGMGLSELLKTADVPKGSFYHYFASKEQLGVVLVEQYFQRHLSFMLQIFQQSNLCQFEKLMQYWQAWVEHNSPRCANGKCLVVKLAGEVSDFSEPMRMALLTGTEQVIAHLTAALSEGCQQGEFHLGDSRQTAELLYNMWLGASLLVKIRLDDSTLQYALQTTEQLLSQPQR